MELNTTQTIIAVLQVAALIYTAWYGRRSAASREVVDDSQAAINYRTVVVGLQSDVVQTNKKIKELEDLLSRSYLDLKLRVEIGNVPIIESFEWKTKNEKSVTPFVLNKHEDNKL